MATAEATYKSGVVTFTLFINGKKADPAWKILSVHVSCEINRIPYARITLLDGDASTGDFESANSDDFSHGNEIEITAGYNTDETSLYKGIIVKHGIKIRNNKPSLLEVECRDKATALTVGRKSAYYYESSDSDVFEEILGDYDLEVEVEATDTKHQELVKYNCTDWDFIINRAEVNGKYVIVKDGKITITSPNSGVQASLMLKYGDNIIEFEGESDARDQYSTVVCQSWDAANQELAKAESTEPDVKDHGNFSAEKLASFVGPDSFDLVHAGQLTDEELQVFSDSVLLKSRLSKIRGRVRFQGTTEVNPGDFVELSGLGGNFNGEALVTGVSHELGNGNWFSNVQFGLSPERFSEKINMSEIPAAGLVPAVSGLHIGIVTKISDDPDSEDRVKIRTPCISTEDEGIWARVATLDAGEGRGSFFRPEIDDEVVVGYLGDDPSDPVILGMMHSSAKPAPSTATEDNHEKGFITRSEMKIWFNDDEKSIEISTPGGYLVKMSEDEGTIIIQDENSNKLEMSSDGIVLESAGDLTIKASGDVNIEGSNITCKADSAFKAEGSSGLEVSSGGTTVVKGSLVQIN